MNIFYLSGNIVDNASFHCDSHVRKMIVEYAQMLSTTHRITDGHLYIIGKKEYYLLNGETIDYYGNTTNKRCYQHTHKNHPCNVWLRESRANYNYLYLLWISLLCEYEYRFEKEHKSKELCSFLSKFPKNLKVGKFTEPPKIIGNITPSNNLVIDYRRYYRTKGNFIYNYTKRPVPYWIFGAKSTSI